MAADLFARLLLDNQNFESSIRKSKKSMKDFKNHTQSCFGSVNSLGRGMQNLSGSLSNLSVGFGGLGTQIGSVNSSLASMGGSLTSLVNPYTAVAAAVVGGAAAFYNYNKELQETLNKTQQFTGLSGDKLANLRNGIKAVADTWGKDYNDVLSGVDGLMSQFHISAEDALRIIKDGFVAGADEGGNLLSLISKYSGAFNDAGISADELVAIIGNTRSGIFNEDGMAIIAKAGNNIRTMSKTTSEALRSIGIDSDQMTQKLTSGEMTMLQAIQEISTKLRGLNPQSQEVGDVLNDVFGKQGAQAGYEFITALADVNTNLDDVKQQTGGVGVATEELYEADRRLQTQMMNLFGVAGDGFETMGTKLKTEVYNGIADVIEGFIDLYNKSILVRGAWELIAATFRQTWDVIKTIIKMISDSLVDLGGIIEGILTLDVDKIKNSQINLLKDLGKGLKDIATKGAENYTDAFNKTLHNKIDKIDVNDVADENPIVVPVVTSGGTNDKGGGNGNNGGNGNKNKDKETAEGSIGDLEKRLHKLNEELTNTKVSDDRLVEIKKEKEELEKEIELLKQRYGLEKTPKTPEPKLEPNEGSIDYIEKQLKDKQIKLKASVVGSDEYNELLNEIHTLEDKKHEIEYQQKVLPPQGSLAYLTEQETRLRKELEVEPIGTERFEQLKAEFDEITNQKHKAEVDVSTTGLDKLNQVGDAIGNIGSAFSSLGSAFENDGLNIAGIIAGAIANIIMSYTSAASSPAVTSTGWGWLGFAAAGIAEVAAVVAQIHSLSASQKMASGGIINGTKFHGDNTLVGLNSGEMVLNRNQQSNLWHLLDNGGTNRLNNTDVHFRISGRDLVGTLSNYNNKLTKSI